MYKLYDLKECLKLKEKFLQEAEYVAGGTDLLVQIREKENKSPVILDISDIKELKGVEIGEDTVTIGAMTTFTEIVSNTLGNNSTGPPVKLSIK